MEPSEYQLTSEVQDSHWIWRGRRQILQTLIEKYLNLEKKLLIADVGCGFGCNIPYLRAYGDVIGLEPNDLALELIHKKWGKSVKVLKWVSPEPLPYRFDLVLMAEVLEHIPDDAGAINWIHEHLKEGGYALVTVPAHRLLWTQMDDITHHQRRYGRGELFTRFAAGFDVVWFSYYNFFLFPAKLGFVFFDRFNRLFFSGSPKRSYNEQPPFLVNKCFEYLVYLEAGLMKYNVAFPFGPSMVMMARKK